jgi:hypothetical protein
MAPAHNRHYLTSASVRFDPTQEAVLRRSESPVSALHVEMCMAQHLLLSAQPYRTLTDGYDAALQLPETER